MQPYLKLDHIDKIFTRGNASTEVLKDINLTIEKGEYVSIIGHSGCGKSTMLNIVAGLTGATMGCVLLENREVNSPGPDRAVHLHRRCHPGRAVERDDPVDSGRAAASVALGHLAHADQRVAP